MQISEGMHHLYSFNWLFGFVSSIVLYTALSWVFPARETLMTHTIWNRNSESIEGVVHCLGTENKKKYES